MESSAQVTLAQPNPDQAAAQRARGRTRRAGLEREERAWHARTVAGNSRRWDCHREDDGR